jgi:hypothetical protein
MIVALVIGAMVLTAILTVYSRANRAAEAVLGRVESPALATEVLQLLAEDLDHVLGGEQGVSIQIKNGLDNGFARAQLVLRRAMRDSKNEEKVFEEITWRAGYDYDGSAPGLVIYRGHEGIDLEDKLLDPKRDSLEANYPLIPLCRGVTCFQLEVPKGDEFLDQWADPALPPGVKVTISFAQPHETVRGTWEVYDEEKIVRTIAIDKTRKIKFVMAAGGADGNDPNAKAGEQPPQKGDGKTPQKTTAERGPAKAGEPGSGKMDERGSRTTSQRAPQRTNEPVPYKPVRPVPGRTAQPRS